MVAAINLAREGYRVRMFEAEEDYGGSSIYNPSTHATPIHLDKTPSYIGVDISPAFHQLRECPAYFHKAMIHFPVYEVYLVERGNRPSALDTLLFDRCRELGVEFEFSSPLRRDDVLRLKPGTIIACGLNPEAYERRVPCLPWHGCPGARLRPQITLGSCSTNPSPNMVTCRPSTTSTSIFFLLREACQREGPGVLQGLDGQDARGRTR